MVLLFQVLAVILAGLAGYFYSQGNQDATFGAVVFAAVSFFLSYRFRVRDRLAQNSDETAEPDDT